MLNTIQTILKHFFLMACLRRTPQQLPASDAFLVLVVVSYLLVACVHNSLHDTVYRSVLIAALDMGIMFLFVLVCLKLIGQTRRWTQTVTALSGTGMILTLLAIPVSIGLNETQETPLYPLFAFLLLFLFIWSLSIQGHIFKHAFSITFSVGLAIAFFYNIMSLTLVSNLLYVPTTQ